MIGEYLGHLPRHDPLYGYLAHEIFPQLGSSAGDGIRVFSTSGSNAVYLYEDRATCARVVGKFFFSNRMHDWETASRRLDREYRNINEFRSLLSWPHYVARPLGRNDSLNRLLVTEYCGGEALDSVISRAIGNHDDGLLFGKLTALAYFLASVHNRSAEWVGVNFDEVCAYSGMLLSTLSAGGMIDGGEEAGLRHQIRRWHDNPAMWQDNRVLVHGDATPANFLFGDGLYVISFDLERCRRTDRVFDVGRLAGELKHFFLRTTGNKYAAEPFIGHFLWEYACHFPDRERAFAAICRRVPFYMGTTLLRIARNGYLPREYRRQLVEEAKCCLYSS